MKTSRYEHRTVFEVLLDWKDSVLLCNMLGHLIAPRRKHSSQERRKGYRVRLELICVDRKRLKVEFLITHLF